MKVKHILHYRTIPLQACGHQWHVSTIPPSHPPLQFHRIKKKEKISAKENQPFKESCSALIMSIREFSRECMLKPSKERVLSCCRRKKKTHKPAVLNKTKEAAAQDEGTRWVGETPHMYWPVCNAKWGNHSLNACSSSTVLLTQHWSPKYVHTTNNGLMYSLK